MRSSNIFSTTERSLNVMQRSSTSFLLPAHSLTGILRQQTPKSIALHPAPSRAVTIPEMLLVWRIDVRNISLSHRPPSAILVNIMSAARRKLDHSHHDTPCRTVQINTVEKYPAVGRRTGGTFPSGTTLPYIQAVHSVSDEYTVTRQRRHTW